MKQDGAQQAGFTLVEMLVVLALMVLATAVSLPYARASLEARRFDRTIQQLVVFLRNAQASALASGQDVEVTYDTGSRHFISTAQPLPVVITDDVVLSLLSIKERVKPVGASYLFFATGGNSGGRIELRRAMIVRSITLNWMTGVVSTTRENHAP